jgi:DNA processing protein
MGQDIGIISFFDEDFPEPLKHIVKNGKYAHPLVLYYKGNIKNVCKTEAIAIIGTRHPTDEGLKMGEYYGRYFAGEGFNIVSGLAMGCDTAAHKGALKAGGITTAFVAHGLDITHPKQNEALAEKIIASNGAIVSEYPIGTPVNSQYLVERNRLQAGLADAVILVQTDIKKGGSMHAVNVAIENKKPVFAVKFDNEQANRHAMSQGNSQLINDKKAIALSPENAGKVIEIIDKNNK